ncbi:ABC transporter permease [Helcococcus bovis]|uniref:ABC transporter permease n=1 Tax=Helcococcus bovis TaxID=3153252 RepID=UPI0038BD9362
MKVFKAYLKVALKYKFILISYIAIFTFMTLIFSQTGNEDISLSRLNIGINDLSNSQSSKDFIKYLSMKNNVKLDKFDENTAKKDLFISKYGVAIIINPDFEKNILAKKEAITFLSSPKNHSGILIKNEANKFMVYANALEGNDKLNTSKVLEMLNNTNVNIENYGENQNKSTDLWLSIYFKMAAFVLFTVVFSIISLSMNSFIKNNIMQRFKISAKTDARFIFETSLGQVLVSIIALIPIILIPFLFIGKEYFAKSLPYIFNLYLLIFPAIGFANLLISITNKFQVINAINQMIGMGFAFLSGIMIPREFLSSGIINFSKIFPYYYYLNIIDMIYKNNFSILNAWQEILILLLFAITSILFAILIRKKKNIMK